MTATIDELAGQLLYLTPPNADSIYHWLAPVGFADWQTAYHCLQRIAQTDTTRAIFTQSVPQLLMALAEAANPDQVLIYFERFVHNAADPLELFQYLADNPRTLEILVTLFTSSQFLTEILLRYPAYVAQLAQFKRPKSSPQLLAETQRVIAPFMTSEPLNFDLAIDALRRFQRQELLRIGMADLLASFDLLTVTAELSHLADSLVQHCLDLAAKKTKIPADNFMVIALGKLGGEELNYSSDIDLLFLTSESTQDYSRLGQSLIDALTRVTAEGFLYRVDMRLRPWGRTGPLVSTLAAYQNYLQHHAGLWEKQALLKARLIAGNKVLGQPFLVQIQPLLFGTPLETVRAEVHALKQRIEGQLRQHGRDWGEVKLGQGSIRDIEFITQYLQLAHGEQLPRLRSHNTMIALNHLLAENLLTPAEYRVLNDGYVFLRTVEHHLQLMHYRQTHTLPHDEGAIHHLAKRLGFQGSQVGPRFLAQYLQHTTVIRLVYQQHLAPPMPKTPPQAALVPHLTRMHATYLETFSQPDIEHHTTLIFRLTPANPIYVEAKPLESAMWQVTIVGYDYLGLLSVICGLFFVHGFDIMEGHVFSYSGAFEPPPKTFPRRLWQQRATEAHRKIVDVFTVRSTRLVTGDDWQQYQAALLALVQRLQAGEPLQAQGKLAKQLAMMVQHTTHQGETLYPVEIEIDNSASRRHTLLRIEAVDTVGFLYEFTNALSLTGVNIRRMTANTIGQRVYDVFYVTDAYYQKITDPVKQHELRVATVLIKQFTHLLPRLPNPELALSHFREFVGQLFTRPNWADELTSLNQPEVLSTLARLLGVSDFLWQDFLRMQHANLFPVLQNVAGLTVAKSKAELAQELFLALQTQPTATARYKALNEFKDREMFRIDMRQIQGHITEFGQFSDELTDLVEVVLEAATELALLELFVIYGQPSLADQSPCRLVVMALGKCGGRELGFASDIELMFIYEDNGQTTGPRVITTAEYYTKLVYKVNELIKTRREGVFELDFQLRPYGKAGSLAVSRESFSRYFSPHGEAWAYERQALVKLRPITGDTALGQEMMTLRDNFIYNGQPFDVAAMRAMRERQVRHWVTAGTINAKSSLGGLVDIEYLVQGLQIQHGADYPQLRSPNTQAAMTALFEAGLLAEADYQALLAALNFLRQLINALRMVRGNSKDLTVPPSASDEFAFLARRLAYQPDQLGQLQLDLIRHMTQVQEINRRLLG